MADRVTGLLAKEKEKRIRIKELQIDYEFPGFQGIIDEAKSHKTAKKSKKDKTEASAGSSRKSSLKEEIKEAPKVEKKSSKKSKSKK